MPKTLLAVDDSATMRKVLEITFGGEDFRVVTADGASAAKARMTEEPVAAVIDTSLAGDDGYALAKELRSRNVRLAVVVMASRYSPYDANRGRDAGVDDYIDKPFDTQALIEKVKKAVIARETREVAKPAPVAAAPAASSSAQSHSPRPPTAPIAPAASAAKPNAPVQRTHTLSFEGGLPVVPPPVRNAPAPAAAAPAPVPSASPAAVPVAFSAPPPYSPPTAITVPVAANATASGGPPPAATHTAPPPTVVARGQTPAAAASNPMASLAVAANGQMAGKLGELGLSAQQVEAVLALSRDVVERVVWEIVPQLAEAIIKEEITRLTKDG